ncbi:hypothetical protein O9929_20565 [Vibrio lentus]|nr:hypothetical protein [Vibrio lentus]
MRCLKIMATEQKHDSLIADITSFFTRSLQPEANLKKWVEAISQKSRLLSLTPKDHRSLSASGCCRYHCSLELPGDAL